MTEKEIVKGFDIEYSDIVKKFSIASYLSVGIIAIFGILILVFGQLFVAEHTEDSNTLKTLTRNHRTNETFYYDVNTNIVYVKLASNSGENSLSPYYVVNEGGEAEIAILGKNYFVE